MEIEGKTPVIKVEGLTKSFGKNLIFRDVSLSISKGSSLVIRGPSGCGKSTLLRCMACLETIDQGEILLCGDKVSWRNRIEITNQQRRAVGMVFQEQFLWPHLSAIENIALPLYVTRVMSRERARESALTILKSVGIGDVAEQTPMTMSGGQRQRVAVARAIAQKPKVLLLDEVTSSLDQESTSLVYDAIGKMRSTGTAVVFSTHQANVPLELRQTEMLFEKVNCGYVVVTCKKN